MADRDKINQYKSIQYAQEKIGVQKTKRVFSNAS
jgi:hypothetical protein